MNGQSKLLLMLLMFIFLRGAELLMEVKEREAARNQRRQHSNVQWLEAMTVEEDKLAPASIGPPPRSHEEIKR